jgi:hypothetical protein
MWHGAWSIENGAEALSLQNRKPRIENREL